MTEIWYNDSTPSQSEIIPKIQNHIIENNLNPVFFYANSNWLKTNFKLNTKCMFSSLIYEYINNSVGKDFIFEKHDLKHPQKNHFDAPHNIIKVYQFLKHPPTEYHVPFCIRSKHLHESSKIEWEIHPGTARCSVLEYITVKKIPIIMFDLFQHVNIPERHYDMRNLTTDDFMKIYRKMRSPIKKLTLDSRYFELSEDHRNVKNFTNHKDWELSIRLNKIFLNNKLCFEKDKDGLWIPILENIRQ